MRVRRLQPDEADLHRDVRLRALSEAGDLLGGTFAEAAAEPAHYWQQLTHGVTQTGREVLVIAVEGGHPVGCAYGMLDSSLVDIGRVRGMWVEPICRARGIGSALLRAVFDWASENRLRSLTLWVPPHAEAAIYLYQRARFRETGNSAPLLANPDLNLLEMAADVISGDLISSCPVRGSFHSRFAF